MRKLFFILFLVFGSQIQAQNVYLDSTTTLINPSNAGVSAGDTIFLEAGEYEYLFIKDIRGAKDTPVVITNYNGEVIIENEHYFGISFHTCKHIHLRGQQKYGIRILKVGNGAGIGISRLSNFFEVNQVEIANTHLAGIMCKTEPGCDFSASRDSFLMQDIHIHHNYLHDIGKEGMYIGSTKYFGKMINCNGKDTLVLPHLLENVNIHDNLIERTGWDGLQVSSASFNCAIYNNRVLYDSQAEHNYQMSGIINGSGTDCDCYNNYIAYGKGMGIEFYGLGGQKIFNNIILEAGNTYYPNDPQKEKHGIYIGHRAFSKPDSSFRIFNNTIIRPKSDGIRFHLKDSVSTANRVQNNIIADPGAWSYYEKLGSYRTGDDAYVFLTDTALDVTISNNLFTRDLSQPEFYDTTSNDFTLTPGSPAIDAGTNLSSDSILFDFYFHDRPKGSGWDIGAFEFDSTLVEINRKSVKKTSVIHPNPATNQVVIQSTFDNFNIYIYSLQGNLIMHKYRLKSNCKLDISNLEPGLYLLNLIKAGTGKTQVHKLIVL